MASRQSSNTAGHQNSLSHPRMSTNTSSSRQLGTCSSTQTLLFPAQPPSTEPSSVRSTISDVETDSSTLVGSDAGYSSSDSGTQPTIGMGPYQPQGSRNIQASGSRTMAGAVAGMPLPTEQHLREERSAWDANYLHANGRQVTNLLTEEQTAQSMAMAYRDVGLPGPGGQYSASLLLAYQLPLSGTQSASNPSAPQCSGSSYMQQGPTQGQPRASTQRERGASAHPQCSTATQTTSGGAHAQPQQQGPIPSQPQHNAPSQQMSARYPPGALLYLQHSAPTQTMLSGGYMQQQQSSAQHTHGVSTQLQRNAPALAAHGNAYAQVQDSGHYPSGAPAHSQHHVPAQALYSGGYTQSQRNASAPVPHGSTYTQPQGSSGVPALSQHHAPPQAPYNGVYIQQQQVSAEYPSGTSSRYPSGTSSQYPSGTSSGYPSTNPSSTSVGYPSNTSTLYLSSTSSQYTSSSSTQHGSFQQQSHTQQQGSGPHLSASSHGQAPNANARGRRPSNAQGPHGAGY